MGHGTKPLRSGPLRGGKSREALRALHAGADDGRPLLRRIQLKLLTAALWGSVSLNVKTAG